MGLIVIGLGEIYMYMFSVKFGIVIVDGRKFDVMVF